MIEFLTTLFKTGFEIYDKWKAAEGLERAELQKRAEDSLAVLRGERKLAHDEHDARTAETRRLIEEEKAKQGGG